MLPHFPDFKPLEYSDRQDIEAVTSKYLPYSDFNFVSMWSWNVTDKMAISVLSDNLVVKFNDYITGELFYSFIGMNEPNATAATLLEMSTKEGLNSKLQLVPDVVALSLDPNQFRVVEMREHFDYVISVERLLPHDGTARPLSSRRRLLKKFKEEVPHEIREINIFEQATQYQIKNVSDQWEKDNTADDGNSAHLKRALDRIFSMPNPKGIFAFGAYIRGELAGYCINELCPHKYVIGHFQQGNLKAFSGIYALLMHETSPYFHALGYEYINLEQDLNVPGLRAWKLSHHPSVFLKKYEVSHVDK